MPDWHFSFIVPGKRLDRAMTAVHMLKPESLHVNPVLQRPSGAGKEGTIRNRIIAHLAANGQQKVAQVADAIGKTRARTGVSLADMAKHKLVRRMKPGVYGPIRGGANG